MKKLLVFLMVVALMSCNKRGKIGYTVPVVDPTKTYDNRSVGVSANDILSGKNYKVINLEICYVNTHAETHKLPDSVISETISFLNKYCHKPGGINVFERGIPMQGGGLYINDLMTIEKVHRSKYAKPGKDGNDTLGIFILVTDGDYSEKNVLGLAYKNTSAALFGGIINANSGGLTKPSKTALLSTVLKHEIGHILGLVNAGTEMLVNHQDDAHGKHCKNPNCLMHHSMQTTDVLNILTGGLVPDLDSNCHDDLKMNGGK